MLQTSTARPERNGSTFRLFAESLQKERLLECLKVSSMLKHNPTLSGVTCWFAT